MNIKDLRGIVAKFGKVYLQERIYINGLRFEYVRWLVCDMAGRVIRFGRYQKPRHNERGPYIWKDGGPLYIKRFKPIEPMKEY